VIATILESVLYAESLVEIEDPHLPAGHDFPYAHITLVSFSLTTKASFLWLEQSPGVDVAKRSSIVHTNNRGAWVVQLAPS
jgi:hypothetical protein